MEKVDYNQDLLGDISEAGVELEIQQLASERIFNPTDFRVTPTNLSMDTLLSRIKENEIDLYPDFQRKAGIWTNVAQSQLIESLLIRIPIPAFYMDGTDENQWLVVDGLQRLTALDRFVNRAELTLTGLEFLSELEGCTYEALPRAYQRRIKETQAIIYVVETTDPDIKFNIFKRINTGGLPLSAQEIRHALNQGSVTKLLNKLSISEAFQKAIDSSIKDSRMADRECIIRFLAFYIFGYENYDQYDLNGFLSKAMSKINKMSQYDIDALEKIFLRTMENSYRIFKNMAFRKIIEGRNNRNPINKALFEVWAYHLSHLNQGEIECLAKNSEILMHEQALLMTRVTPDFNGSISTATGALSRVRIRFECISEIIQKVLKQYAC